jgi:hypothetical protein
MSGTVSEESVAIAAVVDLEGETAGEVGVVDEAMIETETMVEGMTGTLDEAVGEILIDVAQDTRDLPQDVEVILEIEGQLDGRQILTFLVDEVDQDVTKGEDCQHPNLLFGLRLHGLLRGLIPHLREAGAARCQGLHLLPLAGAGPYPVRQRGAVAIGVEEVEEEEEAPTVGLAEGHHLLPISLALHHPSADEERLTLLAYLLRPEDHATTAPPLSASLHRPEDPVVILAPDQDRHLLRDLDLLAVLQFAKYLVVEKLPRPRRHRQMILKHALVLVRTVNDG